LMCGGRTKMCKVREENVLEPGEEKKASKTTMNKQTLPHLVGRTSTLFCPGVIGWLTMIFSPA